MLSPNRPLLVVGYRRSFEHYARYEYKGHRRLEFCPSIHHLRGRTFIMADVVHLHDAVSLPGYDEMYRYALYIDSIYGSRDNNESGTVRGGSEATPHPN